MDHYGETTITTGDIDAAGTREVFRGSTVIGTVTRNQDWHYRTTNTADDESIVLTNLTAAINAVDWATR